MSPTRCGSSNTHVSTSVRHPSLQTCTCVRVLRRFYVFVVHDRPFVLFAILGDGGGQFRSSLRVGVRHRFNHYYVRGVRVFDNIHSRLYFQVRRKTRKGHICSIFSMSLNSKRVVTKAMDAVRCGLANAISARTQATVGGSPFGPFISVARGHSRE